MFQILLTALTAFVIVWLLGLLLLPVLQRLKPAPPERETPPEVQKSQKKKQPPPPKPPAPTMGGVLMLAGIMIATLIFGLEGMEFALPALVATLALGVLGFVDDFTRARSAEGTGLRDYHKLLAEFVIALIVAIWAYRSPLIGSSLHLPLSGGEWDIGFWYVPLVVFVMLAQVNAGQLMDEMDGLVTSVTMVYSIFAIAILAAMAVIANQNGELLLGDNFIGAAMFSASVAGASVGFLCFNTYPARVQAGSSGSLAMGGAVAMLAILSRSILLLPLMGIGFVATLVSLALQALSRKRENGRRLFRAVPLHRHYELSGHPASKIVSMYAIATAAFCGICLLPYLR